MSISELYAQGDPRATVRCRIVDDIDRQPLDRARLVLSGAGLKDPVTAYTDNRGNCSLPEIPRGEYTLSVDKAGYFPLQSGQRVGTGSLQVDARSTAEVSLGDIVLVKNRSLSGTVQWRSGDPADKVVVHALLARNGAAEFMPGDVFLVGTNHRGEFRLEGLKPGRYIPYAYTIGLRFDDNQPRVGLPVFYPGTPQPQIGAAIDVRQTAERGNLLITLEDSKGTSIEGSVAGSPGAPEGTEVIVGLAVTNNPAQPVAGTKTQIGKAFRLTDVPPGSYTLVAMTPGRADTRVLQRIEVGSSPLTDVRISVVESPPIAGRVELVEPVPAGGGGGERKSPLSGARVITRSSELGIFGVNGAESDKEGKFMLTGMLSGYTFLMSVTLPDGMYVDAVSQGERRIDESPYPIAGGGQELRISVRKGSGKLEGRINYSTEKQAGGFVVLVPRDRPNDKLRFKSAEATMQGTFRLSGIAPGEYLVFAFDRDEEEAYRDDQYRRRFQTKAASVTIQPNGTHSVSVELIGTTGRE